MSVHDLPLDGQTVVIPLLLDMYQCPLSGTEPKMLNPRQHEHIVIVVHYYISSSTVTPDGTLSLSIVTE